MAITKKDGTIIVDTLINTKGFNKGIGNMQKSVSGLSGSITKLGLAIGAAFSVKAVINFGKECINLGSDLQEVQNVVDVTFGNMSEKIDEFAKNTITQFGLSELAAKQYASTMGAMLKSMGFDNASVLNMSTTLAGLAGDIASFYNLTGDEAFAKIRAGISGETEPLKQLGINLSVANLEAFALAEGITKSYNAMTEQEKAMLRYNYLLKTTADAQGDFARTSDSWANQTRILAEQFNSLKATIGQGLINVFTPVIKVLNTLLAKLQTVANAFKALTEQIFGKQETQQATTNLGAIEDEYSGIADATEDAKKAQDKYLTGLDEIKTFQTNDDVSTGDVGGIGVINPTVTEEGNKEAEETSTLLDKLIEKAIQLKDLFKQGFFDGLGDPTERINSIKESFESIKQSLSDIFDADFADGMEDYVNRITQAFGVMSGSFTSIGLTIATNLLGGLSGYLESEAPYIKEYLLNMFDIGASLTEKGAELSSAFAYIFESFASENGQQITEDLIAIFANPFMHITELLGQFSLDITNLLVTPFVNSKEQIKTALDDLITGLSNFTGSIRTALDDFFVLINQLYTEHISPVFEELIPAMEEFWNEHISPLISKLGEFFTALGDNINALWNDLFKPFIQWFIDNIAPVITPILKVVGEEFINGFNIIADVIGGFLDVLSGLVSVLVGTFTGDWKRAWEGIKTIFSGVWNAFVGIVKKPINGVIELLNKFLGFVETVQHSIADALSFTIDLPSWAEKLTGYDSFSVGIGKVSIPRIPYLATGAVIPPNAPFMAMLGDQKHGTNIEAPLSTIEQALENVYRRNGNSNGGVLHAHLYLDGREVLTSVIDMAKLEQTATGINPLLLK